MKIVNETFRHGAHAVSLLAESDQDGRTIAAIFDACEKFPQLRAELIRSAGDPFPSLRLEEREA